MREEALDLQTICVIGSLKSSSVPACTANLAITASSPVIVIVNDIYYETLQRTSKSQLAQPYPGLEREFLIPPYYYQLKPRELSSV